MAILLAGAVVWFVTSGGSKKPSVENKTATVETPAPTQTPSTHEVTPGTPPEAQPPQAAEKQGTLLIQANVDHAEVYVDGQPQGLVGAGNKRKLQIKEGEHTVVLKKSGYNDSAPQKVKVLADREAKLSPFSLEIKPGPPPTDAYLTIQSRPGASVRVNGNASGTVGSDGSLQVKANPGSNNIQVAAEGYDPWSSTINLNAGETRSLSADLKLKPVPAPTASISASAQSIKSGDSVDLKWETHNATEVSIDGVGPVSASGDKTVKPSSTTTYTLNAKGAGGNASMKVSVAVEPKPEPKPEARVETPPPPPPAANAGSSSASGDKEAIAQALSKFKEVYEGMVAEDLKSIWPTISAKQINAIKGSYKGVQRLTVTDSCEGSPQVSGDTADWTCHESMTYVKDGKRQEPLNSTIIFRFKKSGGRWLVDGRTGK